MDAILFDLDDTLVVDEVISKEALAESAKLAARLYEADPERLAGDARELAVRLWPANPALEYCNAIGITAEECLWGEFHGDDPSLRALRTWSLAFRDELFSTALGLQGIAAGGRALADEFSTSRRRLQRLMPGARETLALLAPTYQIGLLTNGAPDLQREKIAASGLEGYFVATAVSGEHGVGKPDPRIFEILLGELGCPPERAVMVGNSLARDIVGARNAGIARTVWLQVAGSEEFADVSPDHTITSLDQLPQALALPSAERNSGAGSPPCGYSHG